MSLYGTINIMENNYHLMDELNVLVGTCFQVGFDK